MTGEHTYTMQSPIFGKCLLRPHSVEEEPTSMLGYVEFAERPEHLTVAIWKKGQWVQRNLKPFPQPVAAWYSVEREDGAPIL